MSNIIVIGASAAGSRHFWRSFARVGLHIIKAEGGTTMVQDPNEALFASMPENALRTLKVDFVLPLREIAPKILELVREPWRDKVTAIKSELRTPEGEKNVVGAPGG